MTSHWRRKINFYRLKGYRCRDCGRVFFPRASACVYCGSRSLDEVDLPRRGRLLSYTIIYGPTDAAKFEAPVIVGLVDLGGTRVIAELTDVSSEELEDVMRNSIPLEPVLRRIGADGDSGVIYYAVKFRPAMGVGSAGE